MFKKVYQSSSTNINFISMEVVNPLTMEVNSNFDDSVIPLSGILMHEFLRTKRIGILERQASKDILLRYDINQIANDLGQ
uniref:Uncharacterized protein n=1 Tax=Gloeothece verrucosa (strain PCC 7822) TaxID=497965 RepID=E0U860_GLOV7|nr:hypothetical protein Cyan7822_5388 [Gloeothece verrucosa PCC 7822]